MAKMVDVDAIIKAMGIRTYMQTEWTPATAWGVPIVDAEPVRHGHWINDTKYSGWTCTHCNYHDGNKTDNYCPNCGAKMDGERREDGDSN